MLSAAGEVSSTSSEIEPVSAIVTEACAPIATKEDEDATSERHEDPYIVKNAMAIYSWARFQEGAIKLSDVKEVYMVKRCCIRYKYAVQLRMLIANIFRLWTL